MSQRSGGVEQPPFRQPVNCNRGDAQIYRSFNAFESLFLNVSFRFGIFRITVAMRLMFGRQTFSFEHRILFYSILMVSTSIVSMAPPALPTAA